MIIKETIHTQWHLLTAIAQVMNKGNAKMFTEPLKWLEKNWWGLIVAHVLMLVSIYFLIWQFAAPIGIPNTIDQFPALMKTRIFIHVILTLLTASYITLILDLIVRFKATKIFKPNEKLLLERIGSEITDTPINSCWRISEAEPTTQPSIRQVDDGCQGKILEVTSSSRYAANYEIKPQARLGKTVEIITKFMDNSATFYIQLSLLSKDGTCSSNLWLNIMIGEGKPKKIFDDEWKYYIKPTHSDDISWLCLDIDLAKAVKEIMGVSGWHLGEIRCCRIRGNISLKHISIYGQK